MPTQPITLASLTGFDWFLVALVALSTIGAFRRGLIQVLFSLTGLFAGILLASWNYRTLALTLHRWIGSFAASEIVSFVLILLMVTTLATLSARLLRRTVSAIGLGLVDRLLGGLFGFARGLLLGIAALLVLAAFAPTAPWLRDSRLAPGFLAGAHAVSFFVPANLQKRIASGASLLLHQAPVLFKSQTSLQSM